MNFLNKLYKSIKGLLGRASVCEINENETASSKQETEPKCSSSISNNAKGSISYVDLGLPSGTLWADSDISETSISENCTLPTYTQAAELIEHCQFQIMSVPQENRRYCRVIGPNGNFLYFQLDRYEEFPFPAAVSWCKEGPGQGVHYVLIISEATITIGFASNEDQYPSRMVRI